jgi:hypothetical protein
MTDSLETQLNNALRAIQANKGERYQRLEAFEAWVNTKQYVGRQDWFYAGENAKPLIERAPCIAYPVVKAAIASHTDLLLGEGKRPKFEVSLPVEDHVAEPKTPKPEGSDGFTEPEEQDDEDDLFEDGIRNITKQARFWTAAREVFREGLGCGTGCSIYGVRRGRLFIDTVKAKWCTIERNADDDITRLEIKYPYLDRMMDGSGHETAVARLYRRVIDTERDVTYLPAKAEKDSTEPAWTEDPKRTFAHGLGHCPVVWYASMKGVAAVNRIDGQAIHDDVLDEIFALDCSLSQRHRAALMAGDPQWTEIGVEEDRGPASTGRTAGPNTIVPGANPDHFVRWAEENGGVLQTAAGGKPGFDNPITGIFAPQRPKIARKKGPGEVWRYPDPEVKVQLHTLPADALKAIDDDAKDLRAKIAESLAVVFMDPESVKFSASLSGKALKVLRARQLDRVDQYREDFGDNWIIPQLLGLLRVVLAVGASLRLKSAKELAAALVRVDGLPDIDLLWGEYYENSAEDWKAIAEVLKLVKGAGFATLEQCVKKIMALFGDDDAKKIIAELTRELDEAAEKEAKRENERDQHLVTIAAGTRAGTEEGSATNSGGGSGFAPPAPPSRPESPTAPG